MIEMPIEIMIMMKMIIKNENNYHTKIAVILIILNIIITVIISIVILQ